MRAALLLAALSACAAPGAGGDWPPGIEGGDWRLVALHGEPAPWRASISFGNNGISGLTECYLFAGPAGQPDALSIWPVRFSFGACPDDGREDPFFAALRKARRAAPDDQGLTLRDDTGAAVMRFVR